MAMVAEGGHGSSRAVVPMIISQASGNGHRPTKFQLSKCNNFGDIDNFI